MEKMISSIVNVWVSYNSTFFLIQSLLLSYCSYRYFMFISNVRTKLIFIGSLVLFSLSLFLLWKSHNTALEFLLSSINNTEPLGNINVVHNDQMKLVAQQFVLVLFNLLLCFMEPRRERLLR